MDNKELKNIKSRVDRAVEIARQKKIAEKKDFVVSQISGEVVKILIPLIQQIANTSKITKEEFRKIVGEIKFEAPPITIQPPKVDVVVEKSDPIEFPIDKLISAIEKAIEQSFKKLKFPKTELKIPPVKIPKEIKLAKVGELIKNMKKLADAKFSLDLGGISRDKPLPVILTDEDGVFYKAITKLVSTGGGGGLGIGSLSNVEGRLQVDIISGGGAGEQYADGTVVDASYKGNLMLGTDGANYQILGVSAAGALAVTGSFYQATQPISGTITANAGTNLNTSLLLTTTIFTGRIGEVQATPTANTLLGRLKDIADGQLADGHNVTVDNASLAVTGSFYQATQPVSGTFWQATQPVSGSFYQALQPVEGGIAHDAVDSGNPLKLGAKAIAHGTNPTAVAADDRTDLYANRAGIPFVISGHPNIVTIRANYSVAQTNAAIVTIASGLKIVVTRCSVTVDNACSVDVAARIGFGAANTPTTTGVVLSHPGIAAGSGVVEGSGAGILGIGADDEDLRITSEVATGGSIDVVVSYYTIES